MKRNKFVTYASFTIALSATIALVRSPKYNEAKFEQQQNTIATLNQEIEVLKDENLQLQEQLNNMTLDDFVSNIIKDLQQELEKTNIYFRYSEGELLLRIDKEKNTDNGVSDQFYNLLNQLITCGNVYCLSVHYFGNEIDFSKLNMSNIKELHFESCNKEFDYSPFSQKYASISFGSAFLDGVFKLLENSDCSNTRIEFHNVYDPSFEGEDAFVPIDSVAKFLVEKNIPIGELTVAQWSYYSGFVEKNIAIEDATIEKLCQVNTKKLSITSVGSEEPLNLNVILNSNIKELDLCLINEVYSWVSGIVPRDLQNIQLQSDNPDLTITFRNGTITKDTHFDLPPTAFVNFVEFDYSYKDIEPFYDLENVQGVTYQHSDVWQTDEYDEEVYIEYNAMYDTFHDFINNLINYHRNPKKIFKQS